MLHHVPTPSSPVVATERRRGGTWMRNWSPDMSRRADELLDLGYREFAGAADMPIDEPTRELFRRTYRPAALRLVDDRVWKLVGNQLLAWLAHGGQVAAESARERQADAVGMIDLRRAVRETHRISASPFCPEEPGGGGFELL